MEEEGRAGDDKETGPAGVAATSSSSLSSNCQCANGPSSVVAVGSNNCATGAV